MLIVHGGFEVVAEGHEQVDVIEVLVDSAFIMPPFRTGSDPRQLDSAESLSGRTRWIAAWFIGVSRSSGEVWVWSTRRRILACHDG